jgi:pentapeptide MXKDX repeat protein
VTQRANIIGATVACVGFSVFPFMTLALADDAVVTKTDAMSAGHMSSGHMGMMKKPPVKKTDMENSASKPEAMSPDQMAPDAPK